MWQQGQVFKLKAKGREGQGRSAAVGIPLSARGARLGEAAGRRIRDSRRGAEGARESTRTARARRTGSHDDARRVVDEYLEMHQAEPVTLAKLRWLLGKVTATFGEVRLADLSARDVYVWRLTIPEGHRFEATQALRQVLSRAVAWGLLDSNPAKRGIPNNLRRSKEKRPFESWQQIDTIVERLSPVYGPMVMFAAATGVGCQNSVRVPRNGRFAGRTLILAPHRATTGLLACAGPASSCAWKPRNEEAT
jgi:hypothetical protein